jgi:hypothetical protein
MLDQKLAEAVQRVLSKEDERFSLTATLQRLIDDGIGTRRGKSVYFTDKDRAEMRSWLHAKGYSLDQVDLSGMSRSERLSVTPNEKAGGEAIKRNRVSIKALTGQGLMLGGASISLPAESHLDVDWTKVAGQVEHLCIMLVENYENFNRVHETKFDLPNVFSSPLVVYRGDPNESRLDSVQQFLSHSGLPILAFMDIDPAGIAMASQLPNFVGMVAPALDVLEEQLRSPKTGRRDLFSAQYPVYGQILDRLPADSPCKAIWELVSKHKAGVVQERWISSESNRML